MSIRRGLYQLVKHRTLVVGFIFKRTVDGEIMTPLQDALTNTVSKILKTPTETYLC